MSHKKNRKNIYTHTIDLKPLNIKNMPKEEFRKALEKVEYRGYEVEILKDGRKIVITKPGGKFTFGKIRREDFMVWVYNPVDSSLWLISHKDIQEDIKIKGQRDPVGTIKIIDALERVYNGEDPEDILQSIDLPNPEGEPPELILKAYKWIWGQEDCNYPEGEGRAMSWKILLEIKEQIKNEPDDKKQESSLF